MNMLSIPTLVFALAILMIALGLIVAPLVRARSAAVQPPTRGQQLRSDHAHVIRAIRELDDDHRTGKINAADYKALRGAQLAQGAGLLQQLDSLEADPKSGTVEPDFDAQLENRILRARNRP